MKDYIKTNEDILRRWKQSNKKRGENNFAPDGIMYRGEIYDDGDGIEERLPAEDGRENEIWAKAPLRILFFTKDQNTGGGEAWDVRGETGDLSRYAFYRNLMYLLYGLVNTTPTKKADYPFTDEEASEEASEEAIEKAIELYKNFPLARVNAKKEAGESSIRNEVLREYLNRDKKFIKEQIQNLDADIIVCCGYSDQIEDTGNLLLNFLNNECGYNFEREGDDYWIYYDKEHNKIAINNWHLSVRKSHEFIYNEMMTAYKNFLSAHPTFLESHRL